MMIKKKPVAKVIKKKPVILAKKHKSNTLKFDESQRISIEKWIGKQRAMYRKDALSDEMIKKLEALPNWQWKNRSKFDSFANLLKNYAQRVGHARPPADHLENGVNIYKWVYAQKKRYEKGALDDYEINTLESLPEWTWEIPSRHRVNFDEMLAIAKAYLSQT